VPLLNVPSANGDESRPDDSRGSKEPPPAHAPSLPGVHDVGEGATQVVEHGLERVVAKRRAGLYRPGYRGWTKIKNASYWRRESEIAQMQRRTRAARDP
jgi:hypothetical protein